MNELQKVTVVLPSLDPDEKLKIVIDGLLDKGFTDIILVNDGSKPENLHWFAQMDQHPEVTLLNHSVNRGKGAALKTAFTWFLENRPDQLGVITVDGDNQHHPDDTAACALNMMKRGLVTLGVRDFSLPHVPERSRKGNRITSVVFKIFCAMDISDTQTGLRAIPRRALKVLADVKGERFEYETNMLLAMKENCINFDEVKIRTVYIEENKSSHFRVVRDSWRIYKLIFAHFFKYTISSLLSSVVELMLVPGLTALCHERLEGLALTAVATVGARVASSLVNFYLNKKLVFHSKVSTATAMSRYAVVALISMALQLVLDELMYIIFAIAGDRWLMRAGIHACVMTGLFIFNYFLQQRWVFTAKGGGEKVESEAQSK